MESLHLLSIDDLVSLAAEFDRQRRCRSADLMDKELRRRAEKVKGEDGEEYYEYEAYHGTREPDLNFQDLEVRDPNYSGSLGPGIYLGNEKGTAHYYGDNVLEGKVRFKNPLVIDAEDGTNFKYPDYSREQEDWTEYYVEDNDGNVIWKGNDEDEGQAFADEHDGWLKYSADKDDYVDPHHSVLVGENVPAFDVLIGGAWHEVRSRGDLESLVYWAQSHGHDGLVTRYVRSSTPHEEMVAFDPKQLVPKNPLQ